MKIIRRPRIYLAMALLATTISLGAQAVGVAHAASAAPAITALADDAVFGGVLVSGYGFGGNDPVSVEVINPATGAVIDTVAAGADSSGSLSHYFAFNVPCGVEQVTLRAVDTATNATSSGISLDLGSALGLAQNQLQGAQDVLATLLASPPQTGGIEAWLAFYEQYASVQAIISSDQAGVSTAQATTASCG